MSRTDGGDRRDIQAEEYRAKARESEEIAEQTGDPYIKEQFLKIAKHCKAVAGHGHLRRKALALDRLS
jgi:hypothetical protein